ncbi:tryptophan halogenase family protein [Novosphingobium sp. B 225]|uniref:tryptophan halogenase family protein n=1 Tax=Novosphingobium sp. B 225 TaxID=1961849 RepID=UPI0020CD2984|nr:tryptophan halogenase family protein [Novosphingobium sp. B 225]
MRGMHDGQIRSVVVLGGGTAGWLAAAYLAASARASGSEITITVIEAPDIPTVGVGEGTWPTLRATLQAIGIAEADFIRACDATFKQGSRFDGWVDGTVGDSYLHPFSPPPQGDASGLLAAWRSGDLSFGAAMTPQHAVCAAGLAPRQPGMPDYAGALNYAYHFDATKFAVLLASHASDCLGVRHIADRVTAVIPAECGDIAALVTAEHGEITGDMFIDCSGQSALLIGQHYGVQWVDRSDVLFNDRALALQVRTLPGCEIASQTVGTAHRAGWIWDIALPERRGIGCVYSSRFLDDDAARAILIDHIAKAVPGVDPALLEPRRLLFPTGYRGELWHRNCLAIGQAAGFIEPLEASAIVMIELSLRALAENFPRRRSTVPFLAERFNTLFHYRWERVIEFLKLHYVLSQRSEPYWQAHRDPATVPARLAAQLGLWRDQPPSIWDFMQIDEVFPAASQQFVLYGMGFAVPPGLQPRPDTQHQLAEIARRGRALTTSLPTNRAYADRLRAVTPCQGQA